MVPLPPIFDSVYFLDFVGSSLFWVDLSHNSGVLIFVDWGFLFDGGEAKICSEVGCWAPGEERFVLDDFNVGRN